MHPPPACASDEAAELAYQAAGCCTRPRSCPRWRGASPCACSTPTAPITRGTGIHHGGPQGASAATSIATTSDKADRGHHHLHAHVRGGEASWGACSEALGRHQAGAVDMVATSEISVAFTTDAREMPRRSLDLQAALGECRGGRRRRCWRRGGPPPRHAGRARRRHPRRWPTRGSSLSEMVSYGMKSISLTMLIADADVSLAVGVLSTGGCSRRRGRGRGQEGRAGPPREASPPRGPARPGASGPTGPGRAPGGRRGRARSRRGGAGPPPRARGGSGRPRSPPAAVRLQVEAAPRIEATCTGKGSWQPAARPPHRRMALETTMLTECPPEEQEFVELLERGRPGPLRLASRSTPPRAPRAGPSSTS